MKVIPIDLWLDVAHFWNIFNVFTGFRHRGFTGFWEAEEKSHFLSKWFTMFMMLFFTFGTILVALAMSLWNIYKGNYDTLNWFLPYRLILPIDRSTLFGWYWEFFLQAYSGYAFVLTITSTVTFFGGCSYYVGACLGQFKYMFNEIDKNAENKESDESIEKKVFETVVFHNKVLDVFDIVADIYSAAIFFHLICNIVFFAGAIYQTEMVCPFRLILFSFCPNFLFLCSIRRLAKSA